MQNILFEYEFQGDVLTLTSNHLYLKFGEEGERYLVDLAEGEHQFIVNYFEKGNPLTVFYKLSENEFIEVATGIIDILEKQNFIDTIEPLEDVRKNFPLKCLVSINMLESIET
ncbi:hypothetical protein U2G60_001905 [Vibrio fluvialis]|uniref:hypothetical protein n=1 Tax=Vibrio diazotrophicus TaxID=685 RepID=UPI0005A9322F|nr:hypothetical protein [Vibrio diazotrophicus]EMA2446673.1 hypothetical protein [Vibrio fluvialis]